MPKPKVFVRMRGMTTYGDDGETTQEWKLNKKRQLLKDCKVHVALLLGTEHQQLHQGEVTWPGLDTEHALNCHGLWREEQMVEVLGVEETRQLIRRMQKFKRSKDGG